MLEFGPASQKELRDWTYAHNSGNVLVRAGPQRFRIHRATCMHIFWVEKGLRIAAQPRYCFEAEDEARRWAWQTHHAQLVSCQTCFE
jgi:hypothetical protein